MLSERPISRLASLALLSLVLSACQSSQRASLAPRPVASAPQSSAQSLEHSLTSSQDILASAASVFGDTEPEKDIYFEDDAEPSWDLDVRSYETHERVEHYVNLFSGTARERMAERISRGTRYESMIRNKMRENGLPEDLYYLALIESGYDTHAYSRAAAVGMWQFMRPTGREVGLRIDWWQDERRDPVRSTDAAITYLKSLQSRFGSLYLAAAAYNGGPGRVSRGLTRFASVLEDAEGDDKFFALAEQNYLHAETRNYVPQLIAAALVAKTPKRFGLEVERQPEYAYDSILVEAGTSLGALANSSLIAVDVITDLNPSFIRGTVPPDRSAWVRVPAGSDSIVSVAYYSMLPEERLAWVLHTAESGETASSLAKSNGITVKQLGWYNPDLRINGNGTIRSGQTVRIPRSETLLAARDVPSPTGSSNSLSGSSVHVVKSGESLSVIGRRYGLSVARIKSLNSLSSDRIRVGQRLNVGAGGASASTTASRSAASGRSASATTHVVKRGESLGVIARRYGLSVSRLKSINNLSSDRIKAGQKLVIRQG